GRQERSLPIF
ncbi:hypothetical protein L345_18425, partial [Ophiophagus hannah]